MGTNHHPANHHLAQHDAAAGLLSGMPVERANGAETTSIPRHAEGELVIVLDPSRRRDEHGRVRHTAFWHDPKTPSEGGPADHLRGQVYFANPDENARDLEQREDVTSVRVLDVRPDWC
jgi:hypothetical protein